MLDLRASFVLLPYMMHFNFWPSRQGAFVQIKSGSNNLLLDIAAAVADGGMACLLILWFNTCAAGSAVHRTP